MVINTVKNTIILPDDIKKLPNKPGVYLFKDTAGLILYVGKAKNLKKRILSYKQHKAYDFKAAALLKESNHLDYILTGGELEALLLEARLIQSNQPKFNVLLKSGQPFLYLVITTTRLPELKLVRNKKQKGVYLGPFIEKGMARKVYDFLLKTFRLKMCKKKIENGCLDYHLGICAGSCKPDFDEQAYQERLELAQKALSQDHNDFLDNLRQQIKLCNKNLEFERSQELYGYLLAFEKVFPVITLKSHANKPFVGHDVWILSKDSGALFVFSEINNVLKKKHVFYFPFSDALTHETIIDDYFIGYYRSVPPAFRIVVNMDFDQQHIELLQNFLMEWHDLKSSVTIIHPKEGHEAALVRYAEASVAMELIKQKTIGRTLQTLFKLSFEPHTIDCFDISHKQGRHMVGACVRFTDGQPDKKYFRHFYIKSLVDQNDYAALQEIVTRRYKEKRNLPDLILIDGGKGQLNAVMKVVPNIECASLAKKDEVVFSRRLIKGKKLSSATFVGQVLMALRDYTHHFAISFHRKVDKIEH